MIPKGFAAVDDVVVGAPKGEGAAVVFSTSLVGGAPNMAGTVGALVVIVELVVLAASSSSLNPTTFTRG